MWLEQLGLGKSRSDFAQGRGKLGLGLRWLVASESRSDFDRGVGQTRVRALVAAFR